MKNYVTKKVKQFSEVETLLNNMDNEGYLLRECDLKEGLFLFELYPHVGNEVEAVLDQPVKEEQIEKVRKVIEDSGYTDDSFNQKYGKFSEYVE